MIHLVKIIRPDRAEAETAELICKSTQEQYRKSLKGKATRVNALVKRIQEDKKVSQEVMDREFNL